MKINTFSSTIRRREMDAVLTCMVEEKLGPGELNTRFVQKAKELLAVSGVFALRSPSIALKYALKATGIEKESGVILSALAPSWQYTTVTELGFKPIIVDVSIETGLVTPETVQDGIQKGGRVLLLHESLGQVPNFRELLELNIPIIEDISQNAGAMFEDGKVGTLGTFAIVGLEQNDILTAGGGALLIAGQSRNWTALKNSIEKSPQTDLLPDINSALGFVQIKEFNRNEEVRKEIHTAFVRALMQGKHKTFVNNSDTSIPTAYSFPVILEGSFKEVKQYASKKEIEICLAYENSIIVVFPETNENFVNANNLAMRCVLFPLYPRLAGAKTEKITKVLATLP